MFGRNLIVGSLYIPAEIKKGGEDKRDAFWDAVRQAMDEIGCKQRDVVLLGVDNNGEIGKREKEEAKEEEVENDEGIGRENGRMCIGDWGVGKSNENGRRLIEVWMILCKFFFT